MATSSAVRTSGSNPASARLEVGGRDANSGRTHAVELLAVVQGGDRAAGGDVVDDRLDGGHHRIHVDPPAGRGGTQLRRGERAPTQIDPGHAEAGHRLNCPRSGQRYENRFHIGRIWPHTAPMRPELWLAFLGASIAISVSPGAGAVQSMATGLQCTNCGAQVWTSPACNWAYCYSNVIAIELQYHQS